MNKSSNRFNTNNTEPVLVLIGKTCCNLRKQNGLTQAELAEKLGTTQQYIAGFEGGKRNIPLKNFIALLGSLDIRLDFTSSKEDVIST